MVFWPGPPRPARTSCASSSRRMAFAARAASARTSASRADGAEAGVHVGVVGLEPVPEGAAQHAGRGPRRAALLHEVPSVEEVLGIALVIRVLAEAGERAEHARGPLPSVPDRLGYPKTAVPRGEGSDRGRVPAVEIEVAVPLRERLGAPGVFALLAVRRAVRRAVKLSLGGKRA